MIKALCFTGHRPMRLPFGFDEEHPKCLELKELLKAEIQNKIEDGCSVFLCGASWGTDLICAEIVLQLRRQYPAVRLICVIPHEEQAARWNEETRERYFAVLEQADDNIYVSRRYTPMCYHERNRYLVDQSMHVIAVYDSRNHGGTSFTLDYARMKGRDIVIINPNTLTVEYEDGIRSRLRVVHEKER